MDTTKASFSEYRRLSDLYAIESDEKLLHLRLSFDELTEVAQSALRDELTERDLWSTDQAKTGDDHQPSSATDEPADPNSVSSSIPVWEAKSPEEAEVICHLLKLANIAAVARPLRSQIVRVVEVHVVPEHAEKALTILSSGVPKEVVRELASEFTLEKFVIPRCPCCSSTDVVLESVGNTNHWSCGKCESRWKDDLDKRAAEVKSEQSAPGSTLSEGNLLELASDIAELPWKPNSKTNRRSIGLIFLGTILAVIASWSQPWTTLRTLGLCILTPSEILVVIARFQLGPSFAVRAEARALVTHGLYSRIQNPIYLFGGLALVGLILFLDKPWYLIAFLVVIPVQVVRVRRERKILASKFGDSYLRYRKQTWF
jgi:protein-S-isoprenylcysteine O-methyltransferase Ste14